MQRAGLCGIALGQTIEAFLFMARSFEDSDHLHDGDVKSILAQDKAASPSLLALHITLLAELSQVSPSLKSHSMARISILIGIPGTSPLTASASWSSIIPPGPSLSPSWP